MSSVIENIYRMIYCSVNPNDSLRFNTYFIKCFREGRIIRDDDYKYFKRYYGLYWMNTFKQIDLHNLKVKVSSCCAAVGDIVKPYTMIFVGDTIYIFYSSAPVIGYGFFPIDASNFLFGRTYESSVYLHCFETMPNTEGIISYNRKNKPTLYLDRRDFMPGCY